MSVTLYHIDTADRVHVPELEGAAENQRPKASNIVGLRLFRYAHTNLYQWYGKEASHGVLDDAFDEPFVMEPLGVRKAEIDWFECHYDASDVAYAHAAPKPGDPDWKRKGPNLPRNPTAKVGDVMWRTAKNIGPLGIDHDHWSGYHLGVTEKQAERIAWLISNDVDFPWEDEA